MSLGPQYTSCVEAKDFEPIKEWYVTLLLVAAVGGAVAALFSGGIGLLVTIPALVEALHYTSEWMLNGKLICLHRDPAKMCGDHKMVWAIGEVADTEAVGEDKNPVEDIDNDYSMNVILAPFDMMAFGDLAQKNHDIATAGIPTPPQGDLLSRQKDMPEFSGYFRTMIVTLSDQKYRAWTEVVGRDYGWAGIIGPDQQKAWADYAFDPANMGLQPRKRSVPVLHCEFEGSRIKDVRDATNTFNLGSKFCKKN